MYLILSQKDESHCELNALGHEIHISRFILMSMLKNNYITIKDTIIIICEDRKFLYSKIFENVIMYDDFLNMNIPENNILRLCEFSYLPRINEDKMIKFEQNTKFPLRHYIPVYWQERQNLKRVEYISPERNFDDLLNNNDYININHLIDEKEFIIIHHRYVKEKQPGHILDGKKDIDNLNKIIDNINCQHDIFVFCIDEGILGKINDVKKNNIKIIKDLNVYASLMNHSKCKCVISEWSGAGQLSHYCHNKMVIYYFNHYKENNYTEHSKVMLCGSKKGFYEYWDFHKTTDLEAILHRNIDDMLVFLNKIQL